jgi:hypothetical protein
LIQISIALKANLPANIRDQDMFTAECHCGNLKLAAVEPPKSITRCNCSICHRLGALWAYYARGDVEIMTSDRPNHRYCWGEKTLTYHRCGVCGCTTHYTAAAEDGGELVAINCRMARPSDIGAVAVREFDGRVSWKYLDGQA